MVWRTDNNSSVPHIPAIPAPGSQGFFSNGDPLTGLPATVVDAWWLNMIQEEIRNVVVAAGITPNKQDNSQLLQALAAITGGNIYLPLAGGTMTGQIDFNLPIGPPDTQANGNGGARLTLFDPGPQNEPSFAIGIDSGQLWLGVPLPSQTFGFYGGTSIVARIPPNGAPPTQNYDLVTWGFMKSSGRDFLTANRTYYVDNAGSDTTGDGSAGNPWKTLQNAFQYIQGKVDFAGYKVTIQMADGTYTGGLSASGAPIGATQTGSIIVRGNTGNSDAVHLVVTGAPAIYSTIGASIQVEHLTLRSILSGEGGGQGLGCSYAGEIVVGAGVVFDTCSQNQMYAGAGGSIIVMNDYSITGGGVTHCQAAADGYIELSSSPDRPVTVTLLGTPNFSAAFAMADIGAVVAAPLNNFNGGATGPRYNAQMNGMIWVAGKGANYFPGSVAGSTSTGGQYG
jgi:hypothetical protein